MLKGVAMDREEAIEHYKRVHAEVSTWPLWMQNLLRDSLKPTVDEPRSPYAPKQTPRVVPKLPDRTGKGPYHA